MHFDERITSNDEICTIHYSKYGQFWFHVLTKAADGHTVLFSVSSQSSSTQHRDREACWKTGSDCCNGAENADGGRLCDWQLSAAHARAHCSRSRMTFRGWNGQTCDRKVKRVVRKRMTGQLGCSQPLRTIRTPLNVPQGHAVMTKSTSKSSYNWQKCSISALFK